MGRIAKLKLFVRTIVDGVNKSEVTIDPDGGSNITGEHFSSPGDDSHPLGTDYVVTTKTQRTGGEAVVGYGDTLNTPKANAGEKRIYGRDANTGLEVCEVYLKANGDISLSNVNGSFEIKADGAIKGDGPIGSFELEVGGDFVVNGARITATGDVISATGKSLSLHTHLAGTPPGNTGPPN